MKKTFIKSILIFIVFIFTVNITNVNAQVYDTVFFPDTLANYNVGNNGISLNDSIGLMVFYYTFTVSPDTNTINLDPYNISQTSFICIAFYNHTNTYRLTFHTNLGDTAMISEYVGSNNLVYFENSHNDTLIVKYLTIENLTGIESNTFLESEKTLYGIFDILGREINYNKLEPYSIYIYKYTNGYVEKRILIKQ